MSRSNVIWCVSRGLPGLRSWRAVFSSLAVLSLLAGDSGTLDAQDREPIRFETRIGPLSAVTVYVHDQERALRWYSERLGFEVRTDEWYASGERALAIAPPGQETPLIFLQPVTAGPTAQDASQVGAQSGWVFQTADIADTYMRLRDMDVRFTESPREVGDGWLATFVDLYGNRWSLWQPEVR